MCMSLSLCKDVVSSVVCEIYDYSRGAVWRWCGEAMACPHLKEMKCVQNKVKLKKKIYLVSFFNFQ